MATNHLEQLLAEWYEYQGYYIKRNVMVGKRVKGGFECELDIIAYNPKTKHLIQLEPSLDTNSWATRERRFRKKFDAGKKYIKEQFSGFDIPNEPEQVAIFRSVPDLEHNVLAGGQVKSAGDFLHAIFLELRTKRLKKQAVSEHLTILRSFQYVCEFRERVVEALTENPKSERK